MWKLAVVGSRHWTNRLIFDHNLNYWVSQRKPIYDGIMIITGGAKGADTMAKEYADENDIQCRIHDPNWEKYGKAAGPIRNSMIVAEADEMVAFMRIDKENRGTWDAVRKMLDKMNQVHIIPG